MVTHMKTTIEISDALLKEAKTVAERERTTLRSLVEEGLRHALDKHRKPTRFRLRDASFGGGGLTEEARAAGGEARLREMAYGDFGE